MRETLAPGPPHLPIARYTTRPSQGTFGLRTRHSPRTQLLDVSSTNVGTSWSPVTNFTRWGEANNPINNFSPSAVQYVDTTLYVFFATDVADPFGSGFHIFYIQSSSIYPVHDVGVTGIQVSPANSFPTGRIPGAFYPYGDSPVAIATVSVTVTNYGDQSEGVTVNLQANN